MARRPFLDRAMAYISPARALAREKARLKLAIVQQTRNDYDGATRGRRAEGWRRTSRDANAEITSAQRLLRETSRDMVRNNPFAARGVSAIAHNMVGAGITYEIKRNGKVDEELTKLARAHLDTTACDADGRHDLYGQQLQAARTIVESGAVLARFRPRRSTDKLPMPFQIQLLEPDFLDPAKDGPQTGGGQAIAGIEFDGIGNRKQYWLYPSHPGNRNANVGESKPIPASDIIHCFRADRPGQQHGATWFAPVIVRMRDFADYEDAQLMRQKIAACFTAFVIDDNDESDVGTSETEALEPGIIEHMRGNKRVEFANPPGVDGYGEYAKVSLRAIAAGLGLPYEALTGDLEGVNFSSGRMGWLEFQRSVAAWQWSMFIPQFCRGVEAWFLRAAEMMGHNVDGVEFEWTPPAREMIDPSTEVTANRNAVRSGQKTPSEVVRERGRDPDKFFKELAADLKLLDDLGIVLDSDPRKVSAAGLTQARPDGTKLPDTGTGA